jgi:L-alanine-DL-glutamate epimerase-like enolase superfamily enzyme
MYDVTRCGGISGARKISDTADTYRIPPRCNTGGGPALWYSSIQTGTSLVNFYIMESVYHLYNDAYPHFLKNVPVPMEAMSRRRKHRDRGSRFERRLSAAATP